MKKLIVLGLIVLSVAACDKMGVGGVVNQAVGNWAQIKVPEGCVVTQIASSSDSGVAVLCEDGRLFH